MREYLDMKRWTLTELVNIQALQKMVDNLYAATGIPIGIIDTDEIIRVKAGWQEICTKFHRVHPLTCERCKKSNAYIKEHLLDGESTAYKCSNNLWDIAMPIIVENEHIATVIVGQFFYENEIPDVEYFRRQAHEFGFCEEEYMNALKKVPFFPKEKVRNMVEYYKGLVGTLVESSVCRLNYVVTNEKLQQSEAKLRKLFESMQDLAFVVDDAGRFTEYHCPPGSRLYTEPEDFLGEKYHHVLPPDSSDLLTKAIQRLQEQETIQPFDYSLTFGNEVRWFSAQVSIVKNQLLSGSDQYLIISRDITERKRMEEELLAAKLEAEEANNAKSMFVANISHELRTPITVLLSAIQLFEMNIRGYAEKKEVNFHNHIRAMKQNGLRLLRLVNNLIDVTKIDAGFMKLQLQNVNIVTMVENITISVAEYAKGKGIYVQFDTDVEEKIMSVDPDKIERIMLNLLSNAIKFTGRNGDIFVSIYDRETNVVISVKDTGIGIPKEKTDRVFERFHQVDTTLARRHEGSGIGLSLVKSFVEIHQGIINVYSEVGKGSEFVIELPVMVLDSVQDMHFSDSKGEEDKNFVTKLNIEFSDIYL